MPTDSSYRHSCYYTEFDVPQNDLDFRLRTSYNHAEETFATKARIVVQPMTDDKAAKEWNPMQRNDGTLKIVNGHRMEHFNEAAKGQHIGPDHSVNSKHGYSRIFGGAVSID